jgi:hypothetical protein
MAAPDAIEIGEHEEQSQLAGLDALAQRRLQHLAVIGLAEPRARSPIVPAGISSSRSIMRPPR